jgi:hypothetical protein
MGGTCSTFRISFIEGFSEKNYFGTSRDRCEDNIKMDLQEGWGLDWIFLSQGRNR